MNISPYSTLAASHHQLQSIKNELAKAFTLGELCYDTEQTGSNVVLVVGAKDSTCNIPPFSHPIEFVTASGENFTAIDIRSITAMRSSVNESFNVRNRSEYGLQVRRVVLQRAWNAGAYEDLRNISPLAAQVFARWIPEAITIKFGLDPAVQLDVSIITAFYFFCLFEPDTALSERDRNRLVTQVARAVNTNFERVEEVIDEMPHLGTIKEFCAAIRDKNLSSRLERFQPGVIMTEVARSWFGTEARELVAVALEHPPTFLAILYSAVTDRSYYRSKLGDLVQRSFKKGDQLNDFTLNFNRVIDIWK